MTKKCPAALRSGRVRLKGLPPVVDIRSRVLILGSFPGPMSLKKREYYAYPRNRFWDIIADILGVDTLINYRDKMRTLKDNRIGLWDVIDSCFRNKASDSDISEPSFNDIRCLIKRYPNIKAIFCNGRKSFAVLNVQRVDLGVPFVYLSSTSPANAGHSYAHKKREWKKILWFLY